MISPSEKEKFLEVQNLAFAAAKYCQNQLQEGMTEKDAATIMENYLQDNAVKQYFHKAFAWFGDRTCFKDFSRPLPFLKKSTWSDFKLPSSKNPLPHFGKEFLPTNRKLEKNMAVILDIAPAIDNIAVDIGYSFFYGTNEDYNKAYAFLIEIKNMLPQIVDKERNIDRIYKTISQLIGNQNFNNCHQLYPLGVLGHKLGRLPLTWIPKINILGFHPQAFFYLLKEDITAPFKFSNTTPYLAQGINQDISTGLWAIEPHFGNKEWGLKFEEILVVEQDTAYWLSSEK